MSDKVPNNTRLTWILFTSLVTVTLAVSLAQASYMWGHETRISKTEVCVENVQEDIRDVKDMIRELTIYVRDKDQ